MGELTVTGTVTRTGTTPLALDVPGHYEIIAFGPGGRSWRRDTVAGRYQHGRALLNAVLETGTAVLQVRVHGATWTQVVNRAQVLVDAFSQLAYTLSVTIDGASSTMTCEAADISLMGGETFQKHHAMAQMQEFQLIIPRNPVPVAGVL